MAKPIDGMVQGEWYKSTVQTGSKISDIYASPNPGGTQTAITSAWGSACYDSLRGDIIVTGGGHGDYQGNEGYAFNLTTLLWRIKWYYSTPRDTTGDLRYADGTPPSAHTYTCVIYDTARDKIMRLPGLAPYTTGSAYFSSHTDELVASVESPSTAVPGSWTARADDADGNSDGIWAYNPNDGFFYGMYSGGSSAQGIRHFAPAANTHTTDTTFDSGAAAVSHTMTSAIDPTLPGYLAYCGSGSLQMKRLDTFAFHGTSDTLFGATGATAIQGAASPGFVYDTSGSQFVGWAGTLAGGTDNRDYYTLNRVTKVWTRNTGTGDIPPNPATNGSFTRFAYCGNGLIGLVNSTTEEVYFLKASAPPVPTTGGYALNYHR